MPLFALIFLLGWTTLSGSTAYSGRVKQEEEAQRKRDREEFKQAPKTVPKTVQGRPSSKSTSEKTSQLRSKKKKARSTPVPIVYSAGYNFQLHGLETRHPFAAKRYDETSAYLLKSLKFKSFYKPRTVSWKTLREVHSEAYLKRLEAPEWVFQYFEPLKPKTDEEKTTLTDFNAEIAQSIVHAQRLGTGGTLLATQLALKNPEKWAINLGGGYHHAYAEQGSGFCLLADVPLAIQGFLKMTSSLAQGKQSRVLIVDLDAHHGDGNAAFFQEQPRVAIFDIYNKNIFPVPYLIKAKEKITVRYDHPIAKGTSDADYLALLHAQLPVALEEFKPQLIFYNAGTDIYENDPHGKLKITREGIIARDEFVFREVRTRGIPIVMVLSGGYAPQVFKIIGESIENLVHQGLISILE